MFSKKGDAFYFCYSELYNKYNVFARHLNFRKSSFCRSRKKS
ncbi:hypothetical protein LEP1GSC059_4493 [Leptospira noguchii serovar Panama str. CZ214]|uniref:Uncharacterized protein n=1 Tax=Leptospira noguchii serovar Panama str. CZ214 TaxID=1001595 RepID=T0FPL1_9LEPT|nr:hypothetical protein LEP1GSC059_4493 [Leptospira noguchii serovar Panama str. CZ214]